MSGFDGQAGYVEGALRLLQFVEARRPTGRRFGADADARWSLLRGDLDTVDRIELLLRDADAEWPGAFGARTVYGLEAIAEDEPFGAEWQAPGPVEGEEIWRRVKATSGPTSTDAALQALAAAWKLTLSSFDPGPIGPTDHLLVVGPSAIAGTIEAFATGTALAWADQVTVIATPVPHRQLAAAAGALLNTTRPAALWRPTDQPAPKLSPGHRLVASGDADPADRAWAATLLGG